MLSTNNACNWTPTGPCMLVNASRSILYASSGEDFTHKASDEARILSGKMAQLVLAQPKDNNQNFAV
ncbi:MAG: hypothetical protein EBS53_14540 [Bacteroidetes bacterium]|nr:hypothetical protein [Bacteroidota bacterium]